MQHAVSLPEGGPWSKEGRQKVKVAARDGAMLSEFE